MATIEISKVTQTSITFYLANLDATYEYSDREVEWAISTTNGSGYTIKGYSYLNAYVSSGGEFTFSGLTSATSYYIMCTIYYNGGISRLYYSDAAIYQLMISTQDSNYGMCYATIGTEEKSTSSNVYAVSGMTIYLRAQPQSGYQFASWKVRSPSTLALASSTSSYTYFIMPKQLVWITGMFSAIAANRPSIFSWINAKSSGGSFNLTAVEWNTLCANINAVRTYKGYPTYSFTTAYIGSPFTADMYNQAVYAIQGISGYGAYLTTVYSGNTIYASHLNNLVNELNAIP